MNKDYKVLPIKKEETHSWLLHKHYAKRIPTITHAFGLYKKGELNGVVTFGLAISKEFCDNVLGLDYRDKILELNRLCIHEDSDSSKNLLSFFVGKALSLIPKPKLIVSYADTSQGHHGYIYQATNWIYTGLSAKRKDYKLKGVHNIHSTSLLDREGRHMTKGKVAEMKKKYGDDLYTEHRPRKPRYVYFLGTRKERLAYRDSLVYPVSDYPKGDNKKYDASYNPSIQGILF